MARTLCLCLAVALVAVVAVVVAGGGALAFALALPPVPTDEQGRAGNQTPDEGTPHDVIIVRNPIAFEPPPTQATSASGSRPACSRLCALASRPMTH